MVTVDVAINLPVKSLFGLYTYALPEKLAFLATGWRVVVPFSGQKVEGFITARHEDASPEAGGFALKEVEAALGDRPWFDAEMLATARWLSGYYLCSLAEAMRLFVPGKTSIRRKAVRDARGRLLYYAYADRLKDKTVLAYGISALGREAARLKTLPARAKAQARALEILAGHEDLLSLAELKELGVTPGVLKALFTAGYALQGEKRILRNSYRRRQVEAERLRLTSEQQLAVAKISAAVDAAKNETFLLQGITGSGKTEVYLRAAAHAVRLGRQVLVLVPEIALTAQLVARFQAVFSDSVAVAHSKLSQNERGDVWYRMRTGQARVLIGVRSAVFAPFERLGLVIIDEEHESSYKQEERPCYHAREVAAARCRADSVPLVLGSATPDLCSYYKARRGEYVHLRLTARPNGARLPEVELVDMRRELREKNYSVLSRPLQKALTDTAAAGNQAIVLLNRRGFSTFVMCRDCGTTITCPHCAVALVYHSANESMRCHYCGNTAPVPAHCPQCGSLRIKFFGTGTQKAETELGQLAGVRVLRMDQDAAAAKFAHEQILRAFASGQSNVLIGTQMVAKGHDIPGVTLVGVLSADSAMHLPDYRAGERAFSLLTQAAGRAGRGEQAGRVIFQTYEPENRLLRLAAVQDYDSFAQGELAVREKYGYPPFVQLLKLTVLDKNENSGAALAKRVVSYLQRLQLEGKLTDLTVSGPFPALVAKVRDLYRFNVIVKAKELEPVKNALMRSEFKEKPNLYFDVDPASVV